MPDPIRLIGLLAVAVFAVGAVATTAQDAADAESPTASYRRLQFKFEVLEAELRKPIVDIKRIYTERLKELEASLVESDDVDGLAAVRTEFDDFAKGRVSDVPSSPAELMRMRVIFERELQRRLEDRARNFKPAFDAYCKRLEKLQVESTRANEMRVAVEMRDELAALKKKYAEFSDEPPIFEGFAEVVKSSHRGNYPTYRGRKTMSYWMYANRNSQPVEWRTAVAERRFSQPKIAFRWAGALGGGDGEVLLRFNGEPAISFNTEQQASKNWKSGNYTLAFEFKRSEMGYSGVFTLTVPSSVVRFGRQQTISVEKEKESSRDRDWVMVHDFTDLSNPTPPPESGASRSG